jgi:hypothetical protein
MYREHFVRPLIWLKATTPIWIAGDAVSPDRRVLYWDWPRGSIFSGTWLAHPVPERRLDSEHVDFAGATC